MQFQVYRYNSEVDNKPFLQDFEIDEKALGKGAMLLDALHKIKEHDETLSYRRSCREGVCGSDAINVNGKNRLACITLLSSLKTPVVIRPLPGQKVVRDLIVDMTNFYKQYESVKPYLQNNSSTPVTERLQSPEDQLKLVGLYECILCAACSTSCPSFWWNPEKFRGPAALLQASRFIMDTRDNQTKERLEDLGKDPFSLFRCRGIMSCTDACPKGLNPAKAINRIKEQMLSKSVS